MKDWSEIKLWRAQTRKSLIEQRLALPVEVRRAHGERTKLHIADSVDLRQYTTIGIYWPIRGEMDVRDLARRHIQGGGVVALPVVVAASVPVEFWRWHPDGKIRHDHAKIPIPAEREVVAPDALLIPLVGFDLAGYRLGYGGGYYDRTLAAGRLRPFCIGLGYEDSCLTTIYPQSHDVRMDLIVTEKAVRRVQRLG
jgi:5-formyltetrahydrofolate cyclo-ligase